MSAPGGPLFMTDLHCHLLPGLDDGAQDLDQAVRMLRLAEQEGIVTVFATPHLLADGGEERFREKAGRAFSSLSARCREELPEMRLLPGFELLLGEGLFSLRDLGRFTLGGSGYLLMETWEGPPFELLFDATDWLLTRGIVPVIAHPERNAALSGDEGLLGRLIRKGAKLQINTESVDGRRGFGPRHRAKMLAKRGWVSFLGTDAHGDLIRPPRGSNAVDVLSEWAGEPQALRIARAKEFLEGSGVNLGR